MIRDGFILRGFVAGRILLVAWLAFAGVAGCTDGKRGEPAVAEDAGVRTHVAVGDLLRVSIFELVTPGETWTGDLVVDKDGFVDLPSLGKVHVIGLTIDEVEKVLGEKASWDWMHGRSWGPGPEVKVERVGRSDL